MQLSETELSFMNKISFKQYLPKQPVDENQSPTETCLRTKWRDSQPWIDGEMVPFQFNCRNIYIASTKVFSELDYALRTS